MSIGFPLPHQLLRLPTTLRRRARRSRMATLALACAVVALLVLPFYCVYKPPGLLIRYLATRWPDVLWRVPLSKSYDDGGKRRLLVALTIDDAPSEHTRDILALLKANGARATFFVIGAQVAGREDVLREIVREGHELGNHGMHDEAAKGLPNEELDRQIRMVEGMIRDAYVKEGREWPTVEQAGRDKDGGMIGRYYRPGSGFFSNRMLALVKRLGFRLVLGSIYPHDAQISYWWLNARHVLSMLSPGRIIICHDRRSWTAPMLGRVLPEMKRRGYRAVTVSTLLEEAEATQRPSGTG
jgi:peptidoglycan/xylan/chitin deacetylase (PgdA/CDA1 family)